MTIDHQRLLAEMQRSFCVNPLNPPSDEELLQQIPTAERSKFSSLFFHCSNETRFSGLKIYSEGKIIPMELSSGLAVLLLDLQASDTFLDLCCAPGCKLALAGLIIGQKGMNADHTGSCTGVDVVEHRISVAKAMICKYKVPNARLFLLDARNFSIPPHHSLGYSGAGAMFSELYSQQKYASPYYSSSVYRKSRGELAQCCQYSKVLVDVECTHDGSVKHVCKNGIPTITTDSLVTLTKMQLEILNHAFSITAPGGILVYSTCSLMKEQNEDVVDEFLQTHGHNCRLVKDYTTSENVSLHQFEFESENGNRYLRFEPSKHKIGGFFVAKILKNLA